MNYDTIENWKFPVVEQDYSIKDKVLYALGLGYGGDPLDEAQLRFVTETDLRAGPRCRLSSAIPASGFATAHADEIESIDIKPFVMLPEGRGAVALDALIVSGKPIA